MTDTNYILVNENEDIPDEAWDSAGIIVRSQSNIGNIEDFSGRLVVIKDDGFLGVASDIEINQVLTRNNDGDLSSIDPKLLIGDASRQNKGIVQINDENLILEEDPNADLELDFIYSKIGVLRLVNQLVPITFEGPEPILTQAEQHANNQREIAINRSQLYTDQVTSDLETLLTENFRDADDILLTNVEGIISENNTTITTDINNQVDTKITELENNVQTSLEVLKSITDFDGVVGDGVNDDTQGFQEAIDRSDKLFVPPGDYRITSTLYLSCSLYGVGFESRLIDDIGPERSILIEVNSDKCHFIEGINIRGPGQNTMSEETGIIVNNIDTEDSHVISIRECFIRNFNKAGILLRSGNSRILEIKNSIIRNCGNTLAVEEKTGAIVFTEEEGINLTSSSILSNLLLSGNSYGVYAESEWGLEFNNITFESNLNTYFIGENSGTLVDCYTTLRNEPSNTNIVTNNVFRVDSNYREGSSVTIGRDGVEIQNGYLILDGNYIWVDDSGNIQTSTEDPRGE